MSQDGQGRRARSIAINVQHLAVGDTVMHLIGDLVDDAAAAIHTLINQLSRAPTRLIVNLSAASRIDTSGVGLVDGEAGRVDTALAAERVGSESSCPAEAVAIVLKSLGLTTLPRLWRLCFLWQRRPGNADNAGR